MPRRLSTPTLRLAFLGLVSTLAPSHAQDVEFAPFDGGERDSTRPVVVMSSTSTGDLVENTERVEVSPWGDDDWEDGIRYNSGEGEYVSLFSLPTDGATINSTLICFSHSGGPVNNLEFDLIFYRNSGGSPGSLIKRIQDVRPNGPVTDDVCLRSSAPAVAGFPFDVSQKRLFVGIRMTTVDGIFVGFDTNGPSSAPTFIRRPGSAWEQINGDNDLNTFAFAIDITTEEEPVNGTCPIQSCTTNSTQVCLSDRFQVTAGFVDQGGGSGSMNWDDYRANTGIAYFNDPNNAELVVKVLETCVINDHFWVFAGGLTDQEVDLRICDTQTGVEMRYFNRLKDAFQPITDVEAFATCP